MAHYLMEDPREASRLAQKVDAEDWVRTFVLPNVGKYASILSVGCGSGTIEFQVAKADSSFMVTGVDSSPVRWMAAKETVRLLTNAQVVNADALKLPFPEHSFDFVYSRFLLQYLGRPYEAISEMVRVCKPGGRVLLQDLDGQLVWNFPESEEFSESISTVVRALARDGFDPYVGRKLYTHAYRAGLVKLDTRIAPYHTILGAADEQTLAQWELKLDIARPKVEEILGLDRAEKLLNDFISHLKDPESITYCIQFTVSGMKP